MLGCQNPKMHRASHRTPVWWTGDNDWSALALGVQVRQTHTFCAISY
jgi:hypothetical protein